MGIEDRDQIEDIISQMDWEFIHKIMVSLNWEYGDKGIPSIATLKDTARYVLNNAIEKGEYDGGGFLGRRIEIPEGYYLALHFAIDAADSYTLE